MGISGLGTAIMFAIAALLWFAYLVPTWMRRREYLATERNATRLQQTLRIMAESAEVPDTVRVEATARGAAHQARLLRERQKQQAARERAAISRERAAMAAFLKAESAATRRAAAVKTRRRVARLLSALLVLAALAVAGVQVWLMLDSGIAAGAWTVLGISGSAALVGLMTLSALAGKGNAKGAVSSARRVEELADPLMADPLAPPAKHSARDWTPVPVPKPLYLSRPAPQAVHPLADADRLLREASESAVAALRSAHAEAEVVEFPQPAAAEPAASAMPSRWAAMGVVDPTETAVPDIDEVLRRRRAAG